MVTKTKKREPLTHEEDPILTPSEVARQIGKSPSTVGRWIREGTLAAHRNPKGQWGVRRSEMNKWLSGSNLDAQVR